jgi:chromosome segregation ATPase
MNGTIDPETIELRQRVDAHSKELEAQGREIAEIRGNMQQIDKLVSAANRQSTLQIAAIVITLCLTIAGGLYFQTTTLEKRFDQIEKRFELMEKRMDGVERRMERIEHNLDELNKELRAERLGK